ncbi:MAG TPA: AI-2E family transporter [Pirellulaceae bacterium]|nr:AI-2E family transporter [Pirellulaceae bacterium]
MTLIRFTRHVLVIALTLLGLLVVWQASTAVIILFCSIALATAFAPLVDQLESLQWPRGVAVGTTLLGLLLVIGLVGVSVGPALVQDFEHLSQDVSLRIADLNRDHPQHWLLHLGDPWLNRESGGDEEASMAAPDFSGIVSTVVGTASQLFELLANLAMCVALSLYWTIDRSRLERLWFSLLPVQQRTAAERLWRAVQREVGGYLRSEAVQLLLALFLLWAGFQLIGLRYAALLATVAAVLSLIPWVGTLLAVSVVVGFSSARMLDLSAPLIDLQAILAAGHAVAVLCFLEFVVEPRLFQRDRYNSLWTALTTLALTVALGGWGLIFGPLVGYVTQIVLRQAYAMCLSSGTETPSIAAVQARAAELQTRFENETEVPPEIANMMRRLQAILNTTPVASTAAEGSSPASCEEPKEAA